MAEWLEPGDKAVPFRLKTYGGDTVKLSDFKGQTVVLYFYPRDDTPGCTKEACAFRDRSSELQDLGVALLGISPDTVESHESFRDKYELNFPLLADPDHAISEAYGAWREKNMYGKKSMGIQRSTFIIDGKGKIAKTWKRVQVAGHDAKVIEAVKQLS